MVNSKSVVGIKPGDYGMVIGHKLMNLLKLCQQSASWFDNEPAQVSWARCQH